jgi:hypothetical protein
MKLIITLSLFTILLTTTGNSQIVKAFGIKVGTVTATQSFDYTVNMSLPISYRWGLDASAFIELVPTNYFSLLAETHFIQKGFSLPVQETSQAHPEGTGTPIILNPRLDYLSFPLLAKFRLEDNGYSTYIFAGPRIDFLLGKQDIGLEYTSTDVGATLGIGTELEFISVPKFIIEGRFSPSFTRAFQNDNLTVTNKSFEILLGVAF